MSMSHESWVLLICRLDVDPSVGSPWIQVAVNQIFQMSFGCLPWLLPGRKRWRRPWRQTLLASRCHVKRWLLSVGVTGRGWKEWPVASGKGVQLIVLQLERRTFYLTLKSKGMWLVCISIWPSNFSSGEVFVATRWSTLGLTLKNGRALKASVFVASNYDILQWYHLMYWIRRNISHKQKSIEIITKSQSNSVDWKLILKALTSELAALYLHTAGGEAWAEASKVQIWLAAKGGNMFQLILL